MKLQILSQMTDIASTGSTRREVEAISEFVALYYAKWFLTTSQTVISPRHDIEAIWEMKSYMKSRPNVAAKCLDSIANHTWYLYPTLIPFSLLDPGVSDEEKTEIAERILMINDSKEKDPLSFMYKKVNASGFIDKEGKKPWLSEFVDSESILTFNILKMDSRQLEWMKIPPSMWNRLSGYKKFKDFISNIPVTNDAAERNVKLIQDFVDGSHDEELRQYLLLAVEQKRKAGRPQGSGGKKRKC